MAIEAGPIGVDTTLLIDFLQADTAAVKFLEQHAARLVVTEIVVFELLSGKIHPKEQEVLHKMLSRLKLIPFGTGASHLAALFFRLAKIAGQSLEDVDAMIAGSYMARGVRQIVTRNAKHFEKIEGLTVLTY